MLVLIFSLNHLFVIISENIVLIFVFLKMLYDLFIVLCHVFYVLLADDKLISIHIQLLK